MIFPTMDKDVADMVSLREWVVHPVVVSNRQQMTQEDATRISPRHHAQAKAESESLMNSHGTSQRSRGIRYRTRRWHGFTQ